MEGSEGFDDSPSHHDKALQFPCRSKKTYRLWVENAMFAKFNSLASLRGSKEDCKSMHFLVHFMYTIV